MRFETEKLLKAGTKNSSKKLYQTDVTLKWTSNKKNRDTGIDVPRTRVMDIFTEVNK